MLKLRHYGRYADPYRGNGWYGSWTLRRGVFLTLCFRPFNWHFYRYRDDYKCRWYIGPLEVQIM